MWNLGFSQYIIIPIIQTVGTMQKMVTDFLILAKVVVAMEAAMEEEAMLVEKMAVVVVDLQ